MPDKPPGVVMPITPMLDMTFQLLFFFILNYHPNALEGQMELALPVPDTKQAKDQPANPDPGTLDPTQEPPSSVTLVVRTQQSGDGEPSISRITVKVKKEETESESSVDTPGGNLQPLTLKLAEVIKENGLDEKNAVSLQCERRLKLRAAVKIMSIYHDAFVQVYPAKKDFYYPKFGCLPPTD
jgi:biopolymer transport protein ExbD